MTFDSPSLWDNDTAADLRYSWQEGMERGGTEAANQEIRDFILDVRTQGLDIRELSPSIQRFFDRYFIPYAALQLEHGVLEESVRLRALAAMRGEDVDWDAEQQTQRDAVLADLRARLLAAQTVGPGPVEFRPQALLVGCEPGATGVYTAQLDDGQPFDRQDFSRWVPAPVANDKRQIDETAALVTDVVRERWGQLLRTEQILALAQEVAQRLAHAHAHAHAEPQAQAQPATSA